MELSGIFDQDPKRNPWAGAHLVYVPYCSSDAWVGDATSSFGFQFRGQRIIAALLAQLQARERTNLRFSHPTASHLSPCLRKKCERVRDGGVPTTA